MRFSLILKLCIFSLTFFAVVVAIKSAGVATVNVADIATMGSHQVASLCDACNHLT